MNLNCDGITGHFDPLCDFAKYILQLKILSRQFHDSVLTSVAVELVKDVKPASITAAISTLFPLDNCHVLFDIPILLIVS